MRADFEELAAGSGHSCGLTNGTARCWGRNSEGQTTVPAVTGGWKSLISGVFHTCGVLLADASAHIAARYLRDGRENFPFGLYHLTASGETSWHGFAQHIVKKAVASNFKIQAAPDRIHPIPTAEYPTPAARPANSRLDTSKFRAAFGLQLPDWTHGVDQVLDVLLEQ